MKSFSERACIAYFSKERELNDSVESTTRTHFDLIILTFRRLGAHGISAIPWIFCFVLEPCGVSYR